jgi:ABC-type molybdenum transport system ATPase subunit/photorepair protein PhrA
MSWPRSSALLAKLGLADLMHRKVSEIAYGQQRLLEIAIGLALKPKVLLLDEPAAGVPHDDRRIEKALSRSAGRPRRVDDRARHGSGLPFCQARHGAGGRHHHLRGLA